LAALQPPINLFLHMEYSSSAVWQHLT
jgi:hypothetical protein